jgi:predicted glycogen debranching enzyme
MLLASQLRDESSCMILISREICREEKKAFAHEWLVSNGRRSYASTSIAGALTRRQHGLLVVSSDDSSKRTVTLAKVDEEVEVNGQVYKLGTNEYLGNVINPDGFLYLQQVTFDGTIANFLYEAGRFQLTKTIWMEYERNTTYIRYALAEHSAPVGITLLPLCDFRATTNLTQGSEQWRFQIQTVERGIQIIAHPSAAPYRILVEPAATFTPLDLWYWRFQFRRDNNVQTDLFVPGLFRANLEPGTAVTLIATCENDDAMDFDTWRALERARSRTSALSFPPSDQFTSDVFLVGEPQSGQPDAAPQMGQPQGTAPTF